MSNDCCTGFCDVGCRYWCKHRRRKSSARKCEKCHPKNRPRTNCLNNDVVHMLNIIPCNIQKSQGIEKGVRSKSFVRLYVEPLSHPELDGDQRQAADQFLPFSRN